MNWTLLRGAFYASLAFILPAVAAWAVTQGWGTYDAATGVFDPSPINMTTLAAWIVAYVGGPSVALTAVMRGWGRK